MPKVPYKLAVVLNRLQQLGPVRPENGEWRFRCPAHQDRNPSAYLRLKDDHLLLNCKGDCPFDKIISKLDLVPDDLRVYAADSWVEIDNEGNVVRDSVRPDEPAAVVQAAGPQDTPPAGAADPDLDDKRHAIYQVLLEALPLHDDHRAALLRRGLEASEIAKRGYKSVDRFAAHQAIGCLKQQYAEHELLAVPGFVSKHERVELAARDGILIPVRDAGGRVVALKIRHDNAGAGPKYTYLSSSAFCGGPSPGSPVHFPLGTPAACEEVRVTEGELKADVAFALSTLTTLAVPGVSNWNRVIPPLRDLKPRRVFVAFDQDGKAATQASARALIDELRTEGFEVQVEVWDAAGGKHKGIDDLLAAGLKPSVITGDDYFAMGEATSPHPDPVVPDEPDPQGHAELEHGAGDDPADQGAPAPQPAAEVAPFPLEVLPPALRDFCAEVAKATATPPDFAGVALLTVAGAAVGNSRTICLKPGSWYESALLFTAAVGDPASGKTPAMDMVTRPYEQLQHKILAAHDQEVKHYQQYEKQREQIAKDNKNLPRGEKKKPLPQPATEPPDPERFLTTEATSEALHLRLKQNPRGLLMYADELVSWVRSHGQYKGGRGNDRQLFLSTWSLKPLAVDRKSQGGTVISVPRPFLAVLGGLQPEMLNELEDHRRRADGFIHRVLFVLPPPVSDTKWTEDTVSAKSREAWRNALLALRQLPLPADGDDDAGALALSPEAKELWVAWYNAFKAEQRSPELPPTLIGPYGKLISYCARFALILSQLRLVTGEAADGNVIDAESMRRAVQLVDYFTSHLHAVYSRLELTPEDNLAMRALVWIRRHGKRCTPRELQRAGIPGIAKATVAEEVLRNLADSGYGRIEEHDKHSFTFVFEPR